MTENSSIKKYIAEILGTFVLVLIGCGSAVLAGSFIGNVGVSFAFGLSLLAMVYAIGAISSCHINPAVSIGMLASGRIGVKDTVAYIIMQCIGGIIGAGTVYFIATGNPDYSIAIDGLAQNGYGLASPGGFSMTAAFIAELVLTLVFLITILGATSKNAPKGFGGLAIGASLVFIHLVSIPVTNTSVNPARSLGPAVFVGGAALNQLWLFWIAPILGAILAALIWKILK